MLIQTTELQSSRLCFLKPPGKPDTVGSFLLLNVALIGFFAFAALYHLVLWISSRRETLLAVFAADCAVRALFSSVLIAICTAPTVAEASSAVHLRVTCGMLMMVTWVWSLSLISEARRHRFAWFATVVFAVLVPIHQFVFAFNPPVLSVEQFQLPWGERIANPRLGRPGWWLIPLYLLVLSIELYGLRCGRRVWKRDRIGGTLILLASCSLLMLHGAHLSRALRLFDFPYLGVTGHVIWGCMIGLFIARRNHQLREQLIVSEHRFRGIFDQAFDMVSLMTTDGILICSNRTSLEFAGVTSESVLGKPFWMTPWWAHSPELRDHLREAIVEAAQGQVVRFEVTHPESSGQLAHFDFSLKPVRNERNEITFVIAEGRDITQRKQTDEELRTSHLRSESLSRQLITAQESERRVLARELHDEIGQVLTAIKMNLRRGQRASPATLQQTLEENLLMVDQAIGQIRNLSLSLRPPHLDALGLVAALHWLVQHQARLGGFEGELDVDLGDAQIPSDLETICFRIAQEALTNAVRHGNPTKVEVKLRATDQRLCLSIHDDGIGFNYEESLQRANRGDSFGLTSMEERASLAGGQFRIESAAEQGTKIHVGFPLSKHQPA